MKFGVKSNRSVWRTHSAVDKYKDYWGDESKVFGWMLRSHPRPYVGDWIFIYSKSCVICISGFDSPPHIESTFFVIELCLVENNSSLSFVHFRERDAYQWCLTTACLLSCVRWPGNLKNQSSCPAVTWQPERPITASRCDLAAVAWLGDLHNHDH